MFDNFMIFLIFKIFIQKSKFLPDIYIYEEEERGQKFPLFIRYLKFDIYSHVSVGVYILNWAPNKYPKTCLLFFHQVPWTSSKTKSAQDAHNI